MEILDSLTVDVPSNFVFNELMKLVSRDEVFSDMVITADEPVIVRNAAGCYKLDALPFSADDIAWILTQMEPDWESLIVAGGFSRPYVVGNWRLRISTGLVMRGTFQKLWIRRTPITPIALRDTGLPASVRLMVENPSGLVLIAGATGAGKSTTMAALVDYLNLTRNVHIETIEDPIEFVFNPVKAIFSQREVGVDVPTFFEGVRGAMRHRPDVIVIGEIRDRETADAALLAGESGHLVIATLHASSAFGAVQKILSFFPGDEASKLSTLATSLVGVIFQAQVPDKEKKKGIVAAELLFNHEQQFSPILGDSDKVNAMLNNNDGVSCSFSQSLITLVKEEKISAADAKKAVVGNGASLRKIEEALANKAFSR